MKQWKDCPRDDLSGIPMMRLAGWTPKFNSSDKRNDRLTPDNPPFDAVAFEKDSKVAWSGIDFHTHNSLWRVADLVQGKYENHRTYDTLVEVKDHE